MAEGSAYDNDVRSVRKVQSLSAVPVILRLGSQIRLGGGFRGRARGLIKIAVLDDYQNVALSLADWSSLDGRASITVFNDHVANPDTVVARLAPFQVVCVMRERTPMPRAIIERLPSLRLIASTGPCPYRKLKAADDRLRIG